MAGDFRRQAVLSFAYKRSPGELREVFNKIDYMNLPDPSNNEPQDIIKSDLNPLDFLYDDRADITDDPKFSYYTYEGSMT